MILKLINSAVCSIYISTDKDTFSNLETSSGVTLLTRCTRTTDVFRSGIESHLTKEDVSCGCDSTLDRCPKDIGFHPVKVKRSALTCLICM